MRSPGPIYIRFAAIIVIVALVDGVVVLFATRPLPWAAIIPTAVPLLVSIFVVPLIKEKDKAKPGQ